MSNIAMVVGCGIKPLNKNISNLQSLHFIKQAGFKNVYLSYMEDGWGKSHEDMYNKCIQLGLNITLVHLGYRGTNAVYKLWEEGKAGDVVLNNFKKDLDKLEAHNLNLAVMHLTKSTAVSPMSQIGIDRFKELIKYAESKKITIAFENTAWKGFLELIFDNITSDYMKVCYDSGHDYLHFKNTFDFERFKDKIVATHFHDNDGLSDLHLLPFDGDVDFNYALTNLKKANYKGIFTAETVYRYGYQLADPMVFYTEIFNRLQNLEEEYNKLN